MHIYFSGLSGAGISPLAHIALDAGYRVSGSDAHISHNLEAISQRGAQTFSDQTGAEIAQVHQTNPIDWLVVSSAIPEHHPEIEFARNHGVKVTKRSEFINHLLTAFDLKLIAVSGTHGKTTTTAMVVWLFKQLGMPVSYLIGTNISFGRSGELDTLSDWLVIEADEFDKNMLAFKPNVSVLVSLDYDHPDTYPTPTDYIDAFRVFATQSQKVVTWSSVADQLNLSAETHPIVPDTVDLSSMRLAGLHNRRNAWLAVQTTLLAHNEALESDDLAQLISQFPGTQRRFEQLAPNLYSDYAHTPAEITATLQLGSEISNELIVVYQPHQNIRQHQLRGQYEVCFEQASKVYWLPTYLSREDPDLPVLAPQDLIPASRADMFALANMDEALCERIQGHLNNGDTVVVMGAGDIDPWVREHCL